MSTTPLTDPRVPPPGSIGRRGVVGRLAAVGVGGMALALSQPATARADDPNDADKLLSNLADYAAARVNLGVAHTRTPEEFGAVGDGTTDDAAAIQAGIDDLAAGGGGTLWFTAREYLIGSTIMLKGGITLATGTMHRSLLLTTGTTTLKAAPGLTGWMFDTPGLPTPTLGVALVGFNILGPGAGLSTAVGGIRLRYTLNGRLQWLAINSFSAPCISVDEPSVSLAIEDCVIQTDSTGRTLTEPCGSLDLGGSDHYIRSVQCNGGPSDTLGTDGKTNVTYPGDFYRTGAHIHCITSWIYDLSGEFGDVGIYLDSGANNNRFLGTRADVNAGHGWYLDGASYNQFVGCYAIGNGIATFDAYDGVLLLNGAKGNRWTNFMSSPYGSIYTRYAWNDGTTGNSQADQNVVDMPITPASWHGMVRDAHNSVDPVRYSLQPAGAGTVYERPPSRQMAGNTWFDTSSGALTVSDGTVWRDATGTVVGNLMVPDQATGRNSLKWAAVDSKSVVTGLYTAQGSAAVKEAFADLPKLATATSTSAAVAGGAFQIQGTVKFPVTASQQYTLGCRTLADSVAATVAIGVNWFNSSGGYLSTSYAGGATNSTSTRTTATGVLTAPASAAQAQMLVVFNRAGMATGEKHYLTYAFAVSGTAVTDFIQP